MSDSSVTARIEPVRITAGGLPELAVSSRERMAVITADAGLTQVIRAGVAANEALTVIIVVNAPGEDVTLECEGIVAEGGSLLWQIATLAGRTVRHTLRSQAGAQATSAVDWIAIASGNDNWSCDVRNVFADRDGRGEVTMRAVAQDSANVTLRGTIDIRPQGGGTDTYLTQSVLMLDPTAKIDAVPALEIHTDSVRASHSATVSRMTPEDLFYLTSRGLTLPQARALYIEGFVREIAGRLQDPVTQEVVMQAVSRIAKR